MAEYVTVDGARVGVLMGGVGLAHDGKDISDAREARHRARVQRHLRAPRTTSVGIVLFDGGRAWTAGADLPPAVQHLAGVAAALTHLPILGCPMNAWSTEGLDSLLSMAQMPKGIPVGTLAVGSAGVINAAILAGEIIRCPMRPFATRC